MPIVSCKMNEDEKEMLEMFCLEEDLTMSQVIRKAIKEYIERSQEKQYDKNNLQ